MEDVGDFTVSVTDGCDGSVLSSAATLSAADVVIVSGPVGQTLCVGETVTLFVVTENAASFQW